MATNKKRYRRPAPRRPKAELTIKERMIGAWEALRRWTSERSGKQWFGIGAALLVSIALIALLLFLLAPKPLQLVRDEDGNLVDRKNNITYYLAPGNFEPESWKKEVYAECEDITFHRISDLNPERFLCEVNAGVGCVWYASTVKLPDLSGFRASEAAVCTQTDTVIALKMIKQQSHVDAVVDAMENGESVELVPQANRYLRLKFFSDAYPRLIYDISYLECSDGNYLYDRESGRCVSIGSMLLWYINREDMEFDDATLIPEETESEQRGGSEAP